MANGDIIHQQSYDEAGSGTALAFTPSTTATTGNTLVVCVSIEHFQASTYTPGNGYALIVDPAGPTNMTYDIANNTFDRQIWYSKIADGDDSFELTSSSSTGGWNLWYWEIESAMTPDKVVSTYTTSSVSNFNPAAFPTLDSTGVVTYTIGLSLIHFDGAAKAVSFAGGGGNVVTDRGDIASTGGTKAQTSAADKEVTNGAELDQGIVSWSGGVTGPRNTAIAWKEDAGSGTNYDETGRLTDVTVTTTITDQADLEETGLSTTTTVTTTLTTDQSDMEEATVTTTVTVTTESTDELNAGGTNYDETGLATTITVTTTVTDQNDMEESVATTVSVTTTNTEQSDLQDVGLPTTVTVTTTIPTNSLGITQATVENAVSVTTTLTQQVDHVDTVATTATVTTTKTDQQDMVETGLSTVVSIIVGGFDFLPEPEVEGETRVERGVEERIMLTDSDISEHRLRVRLEG